MGAKLQDRPHHDGDEQHRDIRLGVAESDRIAVAGDQIAQLGFVILGYHWHGGTHHAARKAATIVAVLLPEIG
jgi:hypothetical protein